VGNGDVRRTVLGADLDHSCEQAGALDCGYASVTVLDR
jgi:hypothetical protein